MASRDAAWIDGRGSVRQNLGTSESERTGARGWNPRNPDRRSRRWTSSDLRSVLALGLGSTWRDRRAQPGGPVVSDARPPIM